MSDAGHLFLSFNSRDRDKVRAIHRFLVEHGIVTFIDEQNLRAGQNWPQALEQALRDARAVAVFVGAQVGSWQWPEIGFALDRQANDRQFPVIPVLLDGADIGRSFLSLNTWVDLRGARLDDADALGRLLEAVACPHTTADVDAHGLNPYRGLEVFDEAHAPFFFGREAFIGDLLARLTQQGSKFVAVIGASGSGKSSVVRAGLIPKLRRRRPPHETWDVAVFTPGERPWFRLADGLGALRFPDKSDADLDIEIDKLATALQSGELSLESLLDRILQRQGKLHRLLLVVDQFEELFTLTPIQERAEFIERLLGSLAVEGLVLMPTLRADFYGQAIEADRRLSDLLGRAQVTLGRLTLDELTRAVVEPARLARLEFDPGLPELLLRDAGNEPGNLPLLQHALLELYTQRHGNRLTSAAYQAIGGIRKAIATSAEREFKRFDEVGKGDMVRNLFTQLVRLAQVGEGQEDTRRRVATASLQPEALAIVDEFASYKYRLLVKASERGTANPPDCGAMAAPSSAQETVEVAHEALIREWDRLKGWLNEDRGFYLWRQGLDQALRDYDDHGCQIDYLLHGPALKQAEGKLATAIPEPLTPHQRDFIQSSVYQRERLEREALAEKEAFQRREHEALARAAQEERKGKQAAESAQRAAESSQQAEQSRRRIAERAKRISWIAAAILLIALLVSGVQYSKALTELKKSTSQRLLTEAYANEISDSAYNANDIFRVLFAHDISPGPESYTALQRLWEQRKNTWLATDIATQKIDNSASITSIAFNPVHPVLAWGSSDAEVVEYDLDKRTSMSKDMGKAARPSGLFSRDQRYVQYSRDGKELFSVGSMGGANALDFWDVGVANLKTSLPFYTKGSSIVGVELGTDNVGLALEDTSLLEIRKDSLPKKIARDDFPLKLPERITVAAFSHDHRRIVASDANGSIHFWDLRGGATHVELVTRTKRTDGSFSMVPVAISPDGELIAYSDEDGVNRLYNASTKSFALLKDSDGILTFSSSGMLLASATWEGTIRILDTSTLKVVVDIPRAHRGGISALTVSADGQRFASGDRDGVLRLWQRIERGTAALRMSGHSNKADLGGTYSGGGWRSSEWKEGINELAISVDGAKLATAGGDGDLVVWDLKSGAVEARYKVHTGSVNSVAWTANRKQLISVGNDGTARISAPVQAAGDARRLGALKLNDGRLFKVAVAQDGAIISVSERGLIRWFDPSSMSEIRHCKLPLGAERYVTAFAMASSGKRAAISGSDTFLLIDPRDCSIVRKLLDVEPGGEAKSPEVNDIVFMKRQDWLVAVGKRNYPDRGWIGIYNAIDGAVVSRKVDPSVDVMSAVSVTSEGQYVAAASSVGIRLFSIPAHAWVGVPFGKPKHDVNVQRLAFLPNSRAILAAESDGSVTQWPVLDGWYDLLCSNLHRAPKESDWKTMAQSVPSEFRVGCAR